MDMKTTALPPLTHAASTKSHAYNLMKVAGSKGVTMEKIEATAKEFESQFISQMLESMFATRDVKDALGGSESEETYQSMLVSEYGKIISRSGGIGVADQIKKAMLKLQEMENPHVATPTA